MNPLLPAGYDIAWSIVVAVVAVLVIVALVSLGRVAGMRSGGVSGGGGDDGGDGDSVLTGTQALVWTLLILFVPVLGVVVWFAIGRRVAVAGARRV